MVEECGAIYISCICYNHHQMVYYVSINSEIPALPGQSHLRLQTDRLCSHDKTSCTQLQKRSMMGRVGTGAMWAETVHKTQGVTGHWSSGLRCHAQMTCPDRGCDYTGPDVRDIPAKVTYVRNSARYNASMNWHRTKRPFSQKKMLVDLLLMDRGHVSTPTSVLVSLCAVKKITSAELPNFEEKQSRSTGKMRKQVRVSGPFGVIPWQIQILSSSHSRLQQLSLDPRIQEP